MKYSTNEGQTRRFQIRFVTKEDYFETVSIFRKARIPTIDAEKTRRQRPQYSQNEISGVRHPTALRTELHPVALPSPRVSTPDQTDQKTFGRAIQTRHPTRTPLSIAPTDPASKGQSSSNGTASDMSRVSAGHSSEAPERPLPSNQSRLSNFAPTFGSSAPPSAIHEGQAYSNLLAQRPSTAPVSEQKNLERDLPPERSLPFTVKGCSVQEVGSSKPRRGIVELEEADRHAAASLSESPDTRIETSEKQVFAKDIDTQLLLARVEAKKLKSTKSRAISTRKAKQTVVPSKTSDIPKKTSRNVRCLSCRSKRRKCERSPENPDGICVPCATMGQLCSFVAGTESGLPSPITDSRPTSVQVPNSQEERPQTPGSLRVSLRVKGIPPETTSTVPSHVAGEDVITNSQTGSKRPSQIAMPPPKRAKRAGRGGEQHAKKQASHKSDIVSPQQTKAKVVVNETLFVSPPRTSLDPSEEIRSDATTLTATTVDLDSVAAPIRAAPLTTQRVTSGRSEMTSELEQPNCNSPVIHTERAEVHPADSSLPTEVSKEAQNAFHSLMTSDISDFLAMDSDQQSNIVDSFFSVALFSDDFLELAKIVEHRWKIGTFDGKP